MVDGCNKLRDLNFPVEKNTGTESSVVQSTIPIDNVDAQTWHSRLCHLSDQRLAKIKDKLHCTISKLHKNNPCYTCPLAK